MNLIIGFINKILKIIFTIDIKSSYYLNPPFGFSIFLLLKKKTGLIFHLFFENINTPPKHEIRNFIKN